MLISGFSFVKNGDTLGYPVVEAITSVLPLCDEFVIAVGKGAEDDTTRDLITSIGSPKIRIIDTVWPSPEEVRGGSIYSQQTNIALAACKGDWCFYIQCDEVVHEKYHPAIRAACKKYNDDSRVQGFLFGYHHFWGDYEHYLVNHRFYPFEVRIVRNHIGVASIGDAQSFKVGAEKLNVIEIDALVFHYGYVRHPFLMQLRNKRITVNYHGEEKAAELFRDAKPDFNYGSLARCKRYKGSQPKVMEQRIAAMNWKELLVYKGKSALPEYHERLKCRIRTFIEANIFGWRQPWGYKCYKRITL